MNNIIDFRKKIRFATYKSHKTTSFNILVGIITNTKKKIETKKEKQKSQKQTKKKSMPRPAISPEEREKRNRKRKRAQFLIKYGMLSVLFIAVILCAMYSPLFAIKTIEVEGNDFIGKREIISFTDKWCG